MASIFKQSYMPYVIFFAGLVLIYVWATMNNVKKEGFADAADETYAFKMYYADWCPHCHRAKPEFEKLGAIQTIGGKKVKMVALEEKEIPETVKVSGYPTIHLYGPDGALVSEYSGERTQAGFESFLEKTLAA